MPSVNASTSSPHPCRRARASTRGVGFQTGQEQVFRGTRSPRGTARARQRALARARRTARAPTCTKPGAAGPAMLQTLPEVELRCSLCFSQVRARGGKKAAAPPQGGGKPAPTATGRCAPPAAAAPPPRRGGKPAPALALAGRCATHAVECCSVAPFEPRPAAGTLRETLLTHCGWQAAQSRQPEAPGFTNSAAAPRSSEVAGLPGTPPLFADLGGLQAGGMAPTAS